jgi:hypothetical protein
MDIGLTGVLPDRNTTMLGAGIIMKGLVHRMRIIL